MAHDLVMAEPKKVTSALDDAISLVKQIGNTIETTSQIGDMDLKIGGLGNTFKNLEQLMPNMDEVVKAIEGIQESVESQVAIFKRNNEDISI